MYTVYIYSVYLLLLIWEKLLLKRGNGSLKQIIAKFQPK